MTQESYKRLLRCLEEAEKIGNERRVRHYKLKIEKEDKALKKNKNDI